MAMQPTFAREGERLLYMNHSRPTTSMAAMHCHHTHAAAQPVSCSEKGARLANSLQRITSFIWRRSDSNHSVRLLRRLL